MLTPNDTPVQRLQALQDFKNSQVDYLLATDLASRGLDIKGVQTVINYDMPGQLFPIHPSCRSYRSSGEEWTVSVIRPAGFGLLSR